MSKCCIYCRIAGEPTESNKLAMEAQLLSLRQAASKLGLEIVDERLVYESALEPNRQSIKSLIRDARHNKFNRVLVSDLSRLSRSSGGLVEMGERFNRCGLKVFTPEGEQQLAIPHFIFYNRAAEMERAMEKKALMEYAVDAIEAKGYDRETANDLAIKTIDNMKANPNGMDIDWFLEKILDKETYEEAYGMQMM